MSGNCCARLRRANVELAAVERPRKQSCQNPSKSLAPWPERLHMRPVLHTQKHGWRLRCAASLLRFARQPCFCVCSTWPHVQTGEHCWLAYSPSRVRYVPRRLPHKARALPVFHLDTSRAHAVVEAAARRPRPGRRPWPGKWRSLTRALVRAVYRDAIVYADACKNLFRPST